MFTKNTLNGGIGLCVLMTFAFNTSYAQKQDSIKGHDSLALYRKIKKFASKYKLTTLIYQAVFVDPKPQEYPSQPASNEGKVVNPYLKQEGSIIRKIYITVYDPFGHSVTDTVRRKINPLEKIGNKAHITTRHWVVTNKLLFKENDTLNALAISESERLLRQAVYISDARIFISKNKTGDSVDVHVLVQDKWAITVPFVITDVSANARYRNQNLFGVGQQFEQYVGFKRPNVMDYNGFYNIANLDNTYISATLSYQTNSDGTGVGVSFDRPFYSPLAKWAGGISLAHDQRFYKYTDTLDGVPRVISINDCGYDVWAGKTIKIHSTKSFFSKSSNIIVGGRFYNTTYIKRPIIANDIMEGHSNASTFIGNVGYAIQQYYKDKYIYRFGANEDVPEGLILQFLYGADKKELKETRYYAGLEVARAKHFNFGYLSATFFHSVFFNRVIPNDITSGLKLYYFSDLFRLKKWYFREFVNYNLIYGQNKQADERLTLTPGELYGFNSGSLTGTKKMVANFETVSYAPYNIIGFRIAPVVLVGLGMIGDKQNPLLQSNLYQAYSLGLMFRNENLLSSTFQISVGCYPFLPDKNGAQVVYNPVTSFTLRVRAFAISKPAFISY
ncbi:MAG TPA: hypothetical protein VN026_02280 [Bacteroidia bacterium]|jgi:hypothetical protein|nr:hypothetical protein [Bacteroidia bacterium]